MHSISKWLVSFSLLSQKSSVVIVGWFYYNLRFNEVERGVYWFHLVHPSVCPSIWEKGKEELSPLQYHFKSLHIISRHYKKSLLRSQIYHGYEELSTDTNYPIWRRQKLPYMKKTRKKKQVCGAACFMAAEIKFSEDVRLSVRLSVCGQNRVCSVSSTILVGSISYLRILPSNLRRCVTCVILANSLNLYLWLCLLMTWDSIWLNGMGNHEAAGVSSTCRRSSCSSLNSIVIINVPLCILNYGFFETLITSSNLILNEIILHSR